VKDTSDALITTTEQFAPDPTTGHIRKKVINELDSSFVETVKDPASNDAIVETKTASAPDPETGNVTINVTDETGETTTEVQDPSGNVVPTGNTVTVTVANGKYVFTPSVESFIVGNTYIFDNSINSVAHPLHFHSSNEGPGTTDEGPYDLSFGTNKVVFLNDNTVGNLSTMTTNLTNSNNKLSIRSSSGGWSYVKLDHTIEMNLGNEYQFEFYMDQTGLSKRYGGMIFGHDFSLDSPHQGNPTNHPDAINFGFKVFRNNSTWDSWHFNRLSVVWRDANNNPSSTSNDPTSGVSKLTTALVRYWKLIVMKRDDNGLKDLRIEGYSDSSRASLAYWAYVSELDIRSTDTDIQALQYDNVHIGIVHGGSIGTNDYTILENWTASKPNAYLHSQDSDGVLTISNISDVHSPLFAHCGIHANMGSEVNGTGGIPVFATTSAKYVDTQTGNDVQVTLETLAADDNSLWKVVIDPLYEFPLPDVSAATRFANVTLTDHNVTTFNVPFEFKAINQGQVNVRNSVTRSTYYLSESDGNPYYNGKLAETFIGFWPNIVDKFFKLNFIVDQKPVIAAFAIYKNNFTLENFETKKAHFFAQIEALKGMNGVRFIGTDTSDTLGLFTNRDSATSSSHWNPEGLTFHWWFIEFNVSGTYTWDNSTTTIPDLHIGIVKKLPDTLVQNSGYSPYTLTIPQLLDSDGNVLYENVTVDENGKVL
jgi:hypothetical protein